jgi:putative membrane protein
MAATTLSLAAAAQMFGGSGRQGMMGGWGWGFGILWMLFGLTLVVLVVVLIWRLLDGGSPDGRLHEGDDETPLEILEKRYARGEIDRDEFERMKRDLG